MEPWFPCMALLLVIRFLTLFFPNWLQAPQFARVSLFLLLVASVTQKRATQNAVWRTCVPNTIGDAFTTLKSLSMSFTPLTSIERDEHVFDIVLKSHPKYLNFRH